MESGHIGSQAVALDEDDLDDTYGDRDYINAAAAQDLLSAQLGRDDLQFVEKDYDLDDGEYEVEFVLDGVEYAYEVNALTGKITEMEIDIPEQDDDRDDGIVDDRDDGRDDNWDDGRDDDWDDGQDDNWDDGRDDDWDDGQDDDWDDGQDDDWDDGQDDDWDDGQDDDWDDGQDDCQDDDWDD